MSTDKELRLAKEWPKRCFSCKRTYTPESWKALRFAYDREDFFGRFEARHCVCESTLMVLVEVHDLELE